MFQTMGREQNVKGQGEKPRLKFEVAEKSFSIRVSLFHT